MFGRGRGKGGKGLEKGGKGRIKAATSQRHREIESIITTDTKELGPITVTYEGTSDTSGDKASIMSHNNVTIAILVALLFALFAPSSHINGLYDLNSTYRIKNESECYLSNATLDDAQLRWDESELRFYYVVPALPTVDFNVKVSWWYGLNVSTKFGRHNSLPSPELNYVMTENDHLYIYPPGYSEECRFTATRVSKVKARAVYHSCLSHGHPVKAAGRVWFAKDDVVIWDNFSGHYRADASSLLTLSAWLASHSGNVQHSISHRKQLPRQHNHGSPFDV